ncbi:MAG: hypothetical protein WBD73_14990, partial [Candidatus Acidiferrales bacterium]
VFPYHNRVSLQEAFEGPEPDDGETVTSGSERAGGQQWPLATRFFQTTTNHENGRNAATETIEGFSKE